MLKISNALYKLLHRKHIDWEAVKEVLDSNREYINEIEDDECSLSDSYHELYKRGRDALRLTQLFFDYGFDVSANEGRNGAFCLHQLCWGPYDEYILEIAEVLLEAGADISIGLDEDDERGLLDSISWKTGDWMTGAYEEANVNEAYYIMVKRVTEQKPYKGVRAFRSVVGATVKKIDRIIENPTMRGEEEEHVSYLIYTDKGILTINDFAEFVVNPYATEYAISEEDVSRQFDKIIGAKIKGLRFQKATQAKLSFDNGNALLVASRNDINVDIDGEWVVLTNSDLIPLPSIGTKIEKIQLQGGIMYGHDVRFYGGEHGVYLRCADWTYMLYAHQQSYGNASLRVEKMKRNMTKKLERSIDINNAVISEVHTQNGTINWVRINCDEGYLYITAPGFEDVGVFLVEQEVDSPDKVGRWTENLKKITFPGTVEYK